MRIHKRAAIKTAKVVGLWLSVLVIFMLGLHNWGIYFLFGSMVLIVCVIMLFLVSMIIVDYYQSNINKMTERYDEWLEIKKEKK